MMRRLFVVLALLFPGLACAGALDVSAAASLTAPFKEIGALYTRKYAQAVTFNFGATNELRMQIENGAPADVFASASSEEMDKAVTSKAVAGTPSIFARNRLVVIVPKDNPAKIVSLADLARHGVKFVTTHPNVPIGKYTAQVLANLAADPAFGAAFASGVKQNTVSLETNVKQVVAKVALGEADAGVVYRSDTAGANADKLRAIEIADTYNVLARYPMAVTAASKQVEAARRFIELVLSPEGQAILKKYRFLAASSV